MHVREGMSEVILSVGTSHTLRDAARMMTEKKTGAADHHRARHPQLGRKR